jgi:hypothetical protein
LIYIDDFEVLATVACRVWLRRNAVVFGGHMFAPRKLVKNAKLEKKTQSNEKGSIIYSYPEMERSS